MQAERFLLRPLSLDDIDACTAVAADRGWETTRAGWNTYLRYGEGFGVEDDGRLCATVTRFTYGDVRFIGMLLVLESLERRGIGRNLLEAAIGDARGAALFATPFGLPLYLKAGFQQRETIVTYSGRWSGPEKSGIAVVSMNRLSAAQRAEILRSDREAVGYARESLLEALTQNELEIAVVPDGRSVSYAILRPSTAFTQIGPVIASSDTTAAALVNALGVRARGDCRLSIRKSRTSFAESLTEHGLLAQKETPMMTRGDVPLPTSSWYALALKATG